MASSVQGLTDGDVLLVMWVWRIKKGRSISRTPLEKLGI